MCEEIVEYKKMRKKLEGKIFFRFSACNNYASLPLSFFLSSNRILCCGVLSKCDTGMKYENIKNISDRWWFFLCWKGAFIIFLPVVWFFDVVVAYGGCAGTPACHKNFPPLMMDEMKVIWDAIWFRIVFDTPKGLPRKDIFISLLTWSSGWC